MVSLTALLKQPSQQTTPRSKAVLVKKTTDKRGNKAVTGVKEALRASQWVPWSVMRNHFCCRLCEGVAETCITCVICMVFHNLHSVCNVHEDNYVRNIYIYIIILSTQVV